MFYPFTRHSEHSDNLPSLEQVLTQQSQAPIALWDFAVHCSMRQPQARQWLDFYMAARTHEKMCLVYESSMHCHYSSSSSANARDLADLGSMAMQIQNAAETIYLQSFCASWELNLVRVGEFDSRASYMLGDLELSQFYHARELDSYLVLDASPDYMLWPPEILADVEQRLLHGRAVLDPALFSRALYYAYSVLNAYYFPLFIADAVS
ncbi:hypothetical protein GGI18_004723, partial [Coemansia linderi]